MNTSKIAAGALALLLCAGANAHRVNIFAWIEGDQVVTESKFSSGSREQKGAVTVKNVADGSVLATGVTDDAGVWRFDVTQAMRHAPKGLELEINAGEGHQNQWSIPADELAAADGAGASKLPAAAPVSTQMTQPAAQPKKDSAAAAMSDAELEAVFSRVLDKKLAPVYRELALSHDKTPGIPEIVGGMGWLIGLGGIAAWARRRRS
ncbi:hypothetical protein [Sutterella wadsworthensis]|uniref:hypothetical protein n=1 Tax=Sutterella wadsworthensis TaxID=40545 RepID=UPI003967149D